MKPDIIFISNYSLLRFRNYDWYETNSNQALTSWAQKLVSAIGCLIVLWNTGRFKIRFEMRWPKINNRFVPQSVWSTSRRQKYLKIWYGNNVCSGKWTPSAVVSFRCSNPVTNVIKPQSQAAHFIRRTQDKLKPVYTCLIGWRTLLLAAVIKGGVILIINWLHSAAVWMSKLIEFLSSNTSMFI